MRIAATLALFVCSLSAAPWPLERLFSRPYAWGTPPARVAWSKQGHTLLFLWNAEGGRFMDLYAYHPAEQRLELQHLVGDRVAEGGSGVELVDRRVRVHLVATTT